MSSLCGKLTDLFSSAFAECGYDASFGNVAESQRPDLCQFQCNGALAVAQMAKKNPQETARNIVDKLQGNEMIGDLSVAGPGFINISITDSALASHMNDLANDPRLGCPKVDEPAKVIIDFGGPNVAKPMHVGHLRSTIIGDSLRRLLTFAGHKVLADNHLGDWGTPIGMLICELSRRKPDLPYFNESFTGPYPEEPPVTIRDLEEMYPTASARCEANEQDMAEAVAVTDQMQQGRPGYVALRQHLADVSVPELKSDFAKLNVSFDQWLGESFYGQYVPDLVSRLEAQGHIILSEGAKVIPVAQEGDKKEMPPLLMVKSGGGYLYSTSDLATLEYRRKELEADSIVYVVDKRQSLHFEQLFRAAGKTGLIPEGVLLAHIGFGTVNGPDGKPFKTRAGGVTKLSDLIGQVTDKATQRMREAEIARDLTSAEHDTVARMVGIATLKFADLVNHRESDYVFDMDKFSMFEGKTGPYLLYTAVRIKSIMRKAGENGITGSLIQAPGVSDRGLMLTLGRLPDVVRNTLDSYAPNYLCDFAHALAQEFNRFYRENHILREQDRARRGSWLSLAMLCLRELELILGILGIETPEKM